MTSTIILMGGHIRIWRVKGIWRWFPKFQNNVITFTACYYQLGITTRFGYWLFGLFGRRREI